MSGQVGTNKEKKFAGPFFGPRFALRNQNNVGVRKLVVGGYMYNLTRFFYRFGFAVQLGVTTPKDGKKGSSKMENGEKLLREISSKWRPCFQVVRYHF
jgi:hypothetical protein